MKNLTDYEEDINKCSKCGLCSSVCPVYKVTGNDCAVSKGKFIMLKGILKGDLKLSHNVNKYLDLCLKCGKCSKFCPSDIDVCEIFNCAQNQYLKNTLRGKITRFLQSKIIFNNIIAFLRLFTTHKKLSQKGTVKLLYFKGCVNEVFPKTENALKKILANCDVELIEKPFDCCGLPFLSSGNIERYDECKKINTNLTDCEHDYILTDCASCSWALNNYGANLKTINIGDFLAKQPKKFIFNKPLKVTFHKPCHLENADFLEPLMKKCENVQYIEMDGWDDCCGFAGEFALKNNKISRQIGMKKAQNIIDTNANYVLTLCPSCVLGLHQGFLALGIKGPKILNLTEFLAKAGKIV